jgi:hypothetical protein
MSSLSVEQLRAHYLALDNLRIATDRLLANCGSASADLWEELDSTMTQLTALLAEIARTPSETAADLGAKAQTLLDLLQLPVDANSVLSLAQSLAGDVLRLLSGGS